MTMARFLLTKTFLFLVVTAIILVGMAVGRVIVQNRTLAREVGKLEAQAAAVELKNTELLELVSRLKSDSFLEREARLKLNLRKPGEEVVVLEERSGTQAIEGADRQSRGETNLDRWWRFFFHGVASAGSL